MKIDINKDFEEKYKNTYKGFTGGEAVTAAIALVFAGAAAWAAWHFLKIPINVSIYLGIPVMIPVLLLGFYKYQGTGMAGLIKDLLYFLRTRELSYEAGEYQEPARVFTMKRSVNGKNGSV